jgi:hypothetical protein
MAIAKTGAIKVGKVAKKAAGKAGGVVSRTASSAAKATANKAESAIKNARGPSPNPMTNLIIADIAMRGGGRLLRQALERALLGAKYTPQKAREITKGRSMTQTLVGTAVARIATKSVPGALLVGGGLLAKTLYDRSLGRKAALEGEIDVAEQAERAEP